MLDLKPGFNSNLTTVKNISKRTVTFRDVLSGTNYMLSGSFLISAIHDFCFEYSDYDLYFSKKSDLKRAIHALNKNKSFSLYFKSKYASTYLHKKTKEKIQLVYKLRKDIKSLANSHDFHNCSLAYCSRTNMLYVSKKAYQAWTNSTLDINVSPVFDSNYPDMKYFNQLALLLTRIEKYTKRYDLTISKASRQKLSNIAYIYNLKMANYKHGIEYFDKPILDYAGFHYVFVDIIKTAISKGVLKI